MPGEFNRTAMGAGVPTQTLNSIVSGVTSGLKLDDKQREAMRRTLESFRAEAIKMSLPIYQQYKNEAYADPNRPIDPYRIVGGYSKYFGDDLQPQSGGGRSDAKAPSPKAIAEAALWVRDNPTDPRAAEIKKRLGL
jgi:hypothetical protein